MSFLQKASLRRRGGVLGGFALLLVSFVLALNLETVSEIFFAVKASAVEPSADNGIVQLEKELFCRQGKAGEVVIVKGKGGKPSTEQFLTLTNYFIKKNHGKALTPKQRLLVSSGGKLCAAFRKAETLYVDGKLRRTCGTAGNYSVKSRLCEKKPARIFGFRTIQEAANRAGPGDRIVIREGTYSESVKIRRPGMAAKPLTMESAAGEAVVLDGKRSKAGAIAIGGFGGKYASSFVKLRSLKISNYSGTGVAGVIAVKGSSRVTLESLVIVGNGGVGISVGTETPQVTLWGNVVSGGRGGIVVAEDNRHLVAYNVVSSPSDVGIALGTSGLASKLPSLLHHNVVVASSGNNFQVSLGDSSLTNLTGLFHNVSAFGKGSGFAIQTPQLYGVALRSSVIIGSGNPLFVTGETTAFGKNIADVSVPALGSVLAAASVPYAGTELVSEANLIATLSSALAAKSDKNKPLEVSLVAARVRSGFAKLFWPADALLNQADSAGPAFVDLIGQAPFGPPDIGAVEGSGEPDHIENLVTASPGIPSSAKSGEVSVWNSTQAGTYPNYLQRSTYGSGVPPTPTSTPTKTPPATPTPLVYDVVENNRGIYTGNGASQLNVVPGYITDARLTILHGSVRSSAGLLADVRIEAPDFSGHGYTKTKADGSYVFAVNGGGLIRLRFSKPGFLTSERSLEAGFNLEKNLDDVVLVQLDPKVTRVSLQELTQSAVASGSTQSDNDNDGRGQKSRTARVIVPKGVTAKAILPGGAEVQLPSISIRATEYTVGPDGLARMPGTLPPASGYTYAVELSADEAMALGAENVAFSKPVSLYLENFLGMPVGLSVPVGYYDRGRGLWVPEKNGRVIKIKGIVGESAQVDSNGDGAADSPSELSALGFDADELAALASTYTVGTELWRSPLTHFSPHDCNFPYGPPPGSGGPGQGGGGPGGGAGGGGDGCGSAQGAVPGAGGDVQNANLSSGSIIECENQIVREEVPLAGTGLSLAYTSGRAQGFEPSRTLVIPLREETLPPNLMTAKLKISFLGKTLEYSFPANEIPRSFSYVWNGRNHKGEVVTGTVPFTTQVGFEFRASYYEPDEFDESFARFSPSLVNVSPARMSVTIWDPESIAYLRNRTSSPWSISAQHRLDRKQKVLDYGDGTWRSLDASKAVGTSIEIVATTSKDLIGVRGPFAKSEALEVATFGHVSAPQLAPDGSTYFADTYQDPSGAGTTQRSALRRITTNGRVETLMQTGDPAPSGDRFSQIILGLGSVTSYKLDSLGNAYVLDFNPIDSGQRVLLRKLAPNGSRSVLAGDADTLLDPAEGLSAHKLRIESFAEIFPARDGSLYFLQDKASNSVIWRINQEGRLSRVAGDGTLSPGEGVSARITKLFNVRSIAEGADGSLYFINNAFGSAQILVIRPSGLLQRVAGGGALNIADGIPATNVKFRNDGVTSLTVGSDGFLYFTVEFAFEKFWVARVGSLDQIEIIAGSKARIRPEKSNFFAAFDRRFTDLVTISGGVGGVLLFAGEDAYSSRDKIYRYQLGSYSKPFGAVVVPSEDGSLEYVFGSDGRHLTTRSSLTGKTLLSFVYTENGTLTSIFDGFNNSVTLGYSGTGLLSSITGPYGQKTLVEYDSGGNILKVSYPDGTDYQMTHRADGLLTSFQDPNGNRSLLEYEANGRLKKDTNAVGGSTRLKRSVSEDLRIVESALTSAQGRIRIHRVKALANGVQRREVVSAAGLLSSSETTGDGITVSTSSTGAVSTSEVSDDPRYGDLVLYSSSGSLQMPSGITLEVQQSRAIGESPKTFTRSTALNSRNFQETYDCGTRVVTSRSATGRVAKVQLDEFARPTRVEAGAFFQVESKYDVRGRLSTMLSGVGSELRQTTFNYDGGGRLKDATNAEGEKVSFEYDFSDRVREQTFADGGVVRFEYDPSGNVTAIGPPGRPNHVFTYTATDDRESYAPPVVPDGPAVTLHEYSLDGDLKRIIRPSGAVIAFSYDQLSGKLNDIIFPDGISHFSYSSTTGLLSRLTGPHGDSQVFQYDGSLLAQVTLAGEVEGTVSYTYDNFLRPRTQRINGSNPVTSNYDDDGMLISSGDLTLTRDSSLGLVLGTKLASVTETYSYSRFAEPSSYHATFKGSVLFNEDFKKRDRLGRILEKTEAFGTTTTSFSYSYTSRGQLAEVRQDGVLTASYRYDQNGNRISVSRGSVIESAVTNERDQLVSSGDINYLYDLDGRLKSSAVLGKTTTYRYDQLNALLRVERPGQPAIDYIVDSTGRRIGKKINGVKTQGFLYQSGLRPVAELNAANEVMTRFIYGTRVNVPEYFIRHGAIYRIITDHLGSVRLVVNANTGQIAQKIVYDEFGRVILDTAPGFQPFGFAGGLYDPDTGLTRFGIRDYDCKIGRWTAADPIGLEGGLNQYSYSKNDPVNFIDPLGSSWVSATEAFITGAAIGIATGVVAGMTVAAFPVLAPVIAVAGAASLAYAAYDVGSDVYTGKWKSGCGGISEGFVDKIAGYAGGLVGGGVGIKAGLGPQEPPGLYLAKDAPKYVQPGIKQLEGYHISGNRVQPWVARYDEYGRLIARTDYNARNPAAGIPDTHNHRIEYNQYYPQGKQDSTHYPGEYE